MKKMLLSIVAAFLFVFVFAITGLGQDVSGQWEVKIVSPQGERTTKAELKQEGDNVTGTITMGQQGSLPIKGTAKAGDIKLTFTIKFQDNDLPITLSGKVNGDALKGDADFGGLAQGEWSATKASATSSATAKPTASSGAAGIAGVWAVTFSTPNGDVPGKISITQDGENLSGSATSPDGKDVPVKGSLKGSDLELKYTIKYDGNDMPITMKGKFTGAEIKGNADYGGLAEGEFKGKKN